MRRGFTLVEVLIVVAIIGILAAIAIPIFSGHIQEAKEAAAKDNLRILRNAIELYASQHNNVPPGYPLGRSYANPVFTIFILQLSLSTNKNGQTAHIGADGYPLGPYLSAMPKNPFTNRNVGIPKMITNGQNMPAEATGTYDWIYKAATKDIRLDWPGTDSKGVPYYSY